MGGDFYNLSTEEGPEGPKSPEQKGIDGKHFHPLVRSGVCVEERYAGDPVRRGDRAKEEVKEQQPRCGMDEAETKKSQGVGGSSREQDWAAPDSIRHVSQWHADDQRGEGIDSVDDAYKARVVTEAV